MSTNNEKGDKIRFTDMDPKQKKYTINAAEHARAKKQLNFLASFQENGTQL